MKGHIWFIEDHPEEIAPLVGFLQSRGFQCEVFPWERSTEDRIANGSPPEDNLLLFVDAVIRGENMAEAILKAIRRSKQLRDVPVALLTGTVSSAARRKYETYQIYEIYRKEEFVRQKQRGRPVLDKENANDLVTQIEATLNDHQQTRRCLEEADELAESGQYIKSAEKYAQYLSMVGTAGQEEVRHRLLTALTGAVGQSVASCSVSVTELLRKLQRAAMQAFSDAPHERPDLRREAARYWLGATWQLDDDRNHLPEFAAAAKQVFDHAPLTTSIAEEVFAAIERGMPNLAPEGTMDLLAPESLAKQLRLVEKLEEHDREQSQRVAAAAVKRLLASDADTAVGHLQDLNWREHRQVLLSVHQEERGSWRELVGRAVQVNQSLAYELWECSREILTNQMVQPAWTELALSLCTKLHDQGDSGRAIEVARDLLQRELPEERLREVIDIAQLLDGGNELLSDCAVSVVRRCQSQGWVDILAGFETFCRGRLRSLSISRARVSEAHRFGVAFSDAGSRMVSLRQIAAKFFAVEVETRLNPQYYRACGLAEALAENYEACEPVIEGNIRPYDRVKADALANQLQELRARQGGSGASGGPTDVIPETTAMLEAYPRSILEAVERARKDFSDTLLFLRSALAAAEASPYEKPSDVYNAFAILHEVATEWKDKRGALGRDWRQALAEAGCPDYRGHISQTTAGKWGEEYSFDYKGQARLFKEHITLQAGSADTCLSIHWYRDDEDFKLVIGHCGRHLTNTRT